MLKDLLREVIVLVVGKQAEEISDLLHSKKHVNEFIIAKKLDITINQTRNILYKISDQGLVSSIRKKDKRKGWYTYFWKIEILKSLEFLKEIILKRMNQLDHQIKSRETKIFYICENCNVEHSEENALIHDFTCPECGRIFIQRDSTKVLRELKKEMERHRKKLVFINEEIEKEREILEKIRAREIKAREKLAKKNRKKPKKKVVKKKVKPKTKVKKPKRKVVKKKVKPKTKVKKPKRKVVKKKIIKKKIKKVKPKKKTKKKK